MAGNLYLVGTPIGNLGDMTPRAVETMRTVDFIAAEDTRVTQKLLNHFEIRKPMLSYHQHSHESVSEQIVNRILAGESCAVVTDAGMPCISDPGEDLVRVCAEQGVTVIPIPGPSAVIAALAASGLSTSRFSFEGFLSTNRKNRLEHLESIRTDRRTLLFYEAPHKLIATLTDMCAVLGDRRVTLAREMTKLHEELLRTTFSGALELYQTRTPKGEYVLVIEGAPPEEEPQISLEDAVARVLELCAAGESLTAAARTAAHETGYKKGDLYKEAMGRRNDKPGKRQGD